MAELTFDRSNPRSPEAGALAHTADLLAACDAFQELAEAADASEAAEKIIIGAHHRPWDGEAFTLAELEQTFCEAQITWPEEGVFFASPGDGSPDADLGGSFDLIVRRQARDAEVSTAEGRNNLQLAFLDVTSALAREMVEKAEVRECPRGLAVTARSGPAYSAVDVESAQGKYLWVVFGLQWGDQPEQ